MTQPTVSPLTTHQPWADQLCEWLPELGDTAEQIAAALAERGFTGERECADRCPLANYIRHRLGVVAEHLLIGVDVTEVEIWDGPRLAYVSYDPAGEFVERFDAGDWPELVADPDDDEHGAGHCRECCAFPGDGPESFAEHDHDACRDAVAERSGGGS